MSVKIAVAQLELSTSAPAENVRKMNESIVEAASNGAQLIVLPELANSGYAFKDLAEARRNAIEIKGPEVAHWVDLAREHDVAIVTGVALVEGQALRNSSIIIDGGGVLGKYDKAHLWNNEPDYFIAGDASPVVVDTALGKIGTMVCYDVEFPEWVRIAKLQGAQILALPTNWPDTGLPRNPTPMEVVRVQAAASQNKMVIAACDRTGDENGVTWVSSSVIVDENGLIQTLASSATQQILYAELDLPTDNAISPRNDVLKDRRTDLYSGLN